MRDTEDVSKVPVGVKALSVCPIKPGKAPVGQRGEPVTFAGITFNEGDWVYADAGMPTGRAILINLVSTFIPRSASVAYSLSTSSSESCTAHDDRVRCSVRTVSQLRSASKSRKHEEMRRVL